MEFILLVFLLQFKALAQETNPPFRVVFEGRVLSAFTWNHDLGTVLGACEIRVDSVYQTGEVLITGHPYTLSFEFAANDRGVEEQFLNDLNTLQGQKVVVFASHLQGKLIWGTEVLILPDEKLEQKHRDLLKRPAKKSIEWGPEPDVHTEACSLCEAFEKGDDDRVLRLIEQEIRKGMRAPEGERDLLKSHPCVDWVLPPQAILASLPSYATTIVVLDNGERHRDLYFTIQLGRAPGRFGLRNGNVDAQLLRNVAFNDTLLSNWLKMERYSLGYSLRDGDSTDYDLMTVPDHWLLLRYVYGEHSSDFYNMHPTQETLWEQSLANLKAEGDVYSLCLLTGHINADVRLKTLQILEEIKDVRAVPYLLEMLIFEKNRSMEGLTYDQGNELVNFRGQVVKTLASCLDTRVELTLKSVLNPEMLGDYYDFLSELVLQPELRSF